MGDETTTLLTAARAALDAAMAAGKILTGNGKAIDEHQVHAERLAYGATEVAAVLVRIHKGLCAPAMEAGLNGSYLGNFRIAGLSK